MERLERKLVNRMAEVPLSETRTTVSQWFQRFTVRLSHLLFQQGFLFLIIGFLLGRALILTKMTPFALPFLQPFIYFVVIS
ncbi:Stage II sporulation protein E [Anoxybacillus sp. BCO1]|nr:Stage II sporulation protein E [Anoxybacillus sp. BCO1]